MIGAVLAIGDFMLLLLQAVASVVLGAIGWVLLAIVIAACIVLVARRLLRRRQ